MRKRTAPREHVCRPERKEEEKGEDKLVSPVVSLTGFLERQVSAKSDGPTQRWSEVCSTSLKSGAGCSRETGDISPTIPNKTRRFSAPPSSPLLTSSNDKSKESEKKNDDNYKVDNTDAVLLPGAPVEK